MEAEKNCSNCKYYPMEEYEEPCVRCKNTINALSQMVLDRPFWWEPKEDVADNVNHPAHYQGKYECIDEMIALFGVEAVIHFCMCNVYKYRFRAANKNGKEDLDKADWYMDKLIELEGVLDETSIV